MMQKCDFSENETLGKFGKFFSIIPIDPKGTFAPRDFSYSDKIKERLIWNWIVCGNEQKHNYETIDFEGSLSTIYTYQDGDQETNGSLFNEAVKYIKESDEF